MKRLFCIFTALLLLVPFVGAQKVQRSHVIGFYNLENLFDTYHDEGKNDYEYLPDGANQWTEVKYQKKLHNMATVIRAMKDDNKVYHTILGVSEIENRHVLLRRTGQARCRLRPPLPAGPVHPAGKPFDTVHLRRHGDRVQHRFPAPDRFPNQGYPVRSRNHR